jgi:hypothetical protein
MSIDLNRTSTGRVEYIKLEILLPVLAVVGAIAGAWAFTGCKTTDKPKAEENELPASCTLLALSPEQRGAHQRRLEKLRKASLLRRETAAGFVFAVDLHILSAQDLRVWMENEQKCCSFLRMTSRVYESEAMAEVTVACPSEMRPEVMRTFGLTAGNGTQ